MSRRLFVVERYEQSPGEATPSLAALPAGSGARLAAAAYLPGDEVVIAFVEARDEQAVLAAADAAGWRVDRLAPAAWVSTPESTDTSQATKTGG